LIALAKDISAEAARGTELGSNNEEPAYYDALMENGSARELMADEQLRLLAQMLVRTICSSATIDWTKKESVRAKYGQRSASCSPGTATRRTSKGLPSTSSSAKERLNKGLAHG
jgi:Domain of unknown function (DUF3387)